MNIIITGASGGLGRAIASEFSIAFELAKTLDNIFLLTYNSNYENVKTIAEVLAQKNEVFISQLDLTQRDNISQTINEFTKKCGDIDILINNAGIISDRTLKNMSDEEWDKVINTNLTGLFNITRAVIPQMKEEGCIINISSVIGITGNFGQANYAASKAGIIGFSKSLAKELAYKKIRVNVVAPGFMETDMTAKIPENIKQQIKGKILLGRFAKPSEVASFIVWLAIEGTYCTGQVYVIDGGFS